MCLWQKILLYPPNSWANLNVTAMGSIVELMQWIQLNYFKVPQISVYAIKNCLKSLLCFHNKDPPIMLPSVIPALISISDCSKLCCYLFDPEGEIWRSHIFIMLTTKFNYDKNGITTINCHAGSQQAERERCICSEQWELLWSCERNRD